MSAALVDAGPLVAVFGRDEPSGSHYRALLARAAAELWSLATTWPCVVEASHMLEPVRRYAMLRWIAGNVVPVYPFGIQQLDVMAQLMRRYTDSPPTEMDLADASPVWLASDTGVTRIMTLDVRDFSRYRLPDGRAFEIL